MTQSLVLDMDDSLRGLDHAARLDLRVWQEPIRFGCSMATWQRLRQHLAANLPRSHGTVFLGSGDFHHLSHLLIERLPRGEPFDVVVFDNHPDNMRFPFGIHCGSWVRHVARLPLVRCVHVLGITSADVALSHAWENYWLPILRGKVRYWTTGVDTRWANKLGLGQAIRSFVDAPALIAGFLGELSNNVPAAAYLSVDKDVLSAEVARTNWDQGCFSLDDIRQVISGLSGKIIGSDVTGEISLHQYTTPWKRWLSALDQQSAVSPSHLAQWQAGHQAVNEHLLEWLAGASLAA